MSEVAVSPEPTMPYGIDSYLEWIEREGLRLNEGLALNLFHVDMDIWPRYGVKAAATMFKGGGDWCSMFVFDIGAGKSTDPVRHLYESFYFVVDGRGNTELEFADGSKRSFEWGPRSFFAIPLNVKYRHFNASGSQRALLAATTTAPMMMKMFHNEEFIFNCPFQFGDRIGRDGFYKGEGNLHLIGAGLNTWETNFVPDLADIKLTSYEERGAGSFNIKFQMADAPMHAHVSEIAPATYKKAHRHGAGTHVLTLGGEGYSLLWAPGDKDFERVDWAYGVVFPPSAQQFHQHFVTSDHPSRYLATTLGGVKYLLTAQQRRTSGLGAANAEGKRSVKEGGDQIEYEDQDPRIHEMWLAEMKKRGITPRLELPAKKG